MFIVIVTLVLVCDLLWWRWADRKARGTRHPKVWRPLVGLWSGLLLGYLAWFITFPAQGRHAHAWMPVWALAFIYLWHLLILPVTMVSILLGKIAGGARLAWRRIMTSRVPTPHATIQGLAEAMKSEERGELTLTRRQAIGAALVAAPPLLTAGAVGAGLAQLNHFRIRHIEVALPQLPAALDGITIAHVSDTHFGRFTRAGAIPAIADATNQLKADLVLFAGDLIDLALADLPTGIDFMKRIDPRGGMFMVEGNHDLIEDPAAFELRVRAAGLPLLLDESATATVRGVPIQILGLTWRHGDANIVGAMSRLVPQRRPDMFQILLAHHPHAFDPAAAVGIPLTISGHTHGGQIMLSERLGAGLVMFRYWSGLYRKNSSALVVSNGVGNWFPLRINAPAEIVHLTLRRG